MAEEEPTGPEQPVLFEIAWEAANKVGGIYTVVKTKAPVTVKEFGNRLCFIGPLSASAQVEVEPLTPTSPAMKKAIESITSTGIKVVYGRWLIEGSPRILLFDLGSAWGNLAGWKLDIWEKASIPSPDDKEMNDAIVFGYLTAWFLGEYVHRAPNTYVIAHFHEWLVGVGLVLCKIRQIKLATIFTTHATLLGRYLCAGEVDFYNNLSFFNADEEARKRNIYHRFFLERASAHCAHVFTTVSHITGYEAEHLLKRKPDGILPNGLSVVKFSAIHEFQNLHATNKEKIQEFVRGHFCGHYDFDLENTLYFFTAGRYEYRNKGVDMYIEALHRLNQRLKHYNSSVTVVGFFIMNAQTKSLNVDALKGQAVSKQLRAAVAEVQGKIGKRIFEQAARGNLPDPSNLLSQEELITLKRRIFAIKRDGLPPIVTHNLLDDANDPVLNHLRRTRLFNDHNDRVKVVFHPEFLSSNSPLFPIDYEDFVRGCHLGVFPSYYEPWGYTPAECTVMGVPSISTNLAGFGCYMQEKVENPNAYGIYIADRRTKSYDESVNEIVDYMFNFCQFSRRERINLRNRTERLSELLDWESMGVEYVKARKLALLRCFPDAYSFLDAKQFIDSEDKLPKPLSAPSSPKIFAKEHD